MTNALTRQDIDCKRQAPLIKVVHELLVQAGMERSKAFDTADTIVRTLEPHIASGLFAVVHNNLLDVVNTLTKPHNGGLRPNQEEMLRGILESVELQQRVFADAMNAERAANLKAKR
jgi:hypothetical protein